MHDPSMSRNMEPDSNLFICQTSSKIHWICYCSTHASHDIMDESQQHLQGLLPVSTLSNASNKAHHADQMFPCSHFCAGWSSSATNQSCQSYNPRIQSGNHLLRHVLRLFYNQAHDSKHKLAWPARAAVTAAQKAQSDTITIDLTRCLAVNITALLYRLSPDNTCDQNGKGISKRRPSCTLCIT